MKKDKYEEYNGIFGNAIDYAVYHMKKKEIFLGMIMGMAVGTVAITIFFGIPLLTMISLPFCAVGGIFLYREHLLQKRKKMMIIQFRDLLESISSSLGSGRNVVEAFSGASSELQNQYGEEAPIVSELHLINRGIANNINLEELLQDFGKRSHNENVQSFADVFLVANRRGGNIRQIIFETKNVIGEKIMVEQDIQTVISGKKNELNIMMLLPFIVVNQTNGLQGNQGEDILFSFLVKVAAFFIFVFAYWLGNKMMKIQV